MIIENNKRDSEDMKTQKKIEGCLIGGAVGDALGYGVEFMNLAQIKSIYGDAGITKYKNGVGLISDDTQMTLFTACGILDGYTRGHMRGIMGSLEYYVWRVYGSWYNTQIQDRQLKRKENNTWLVAIDELYARRATGNTCLHAISGGYMGML